MLREWGQNEEKCFSIKCITLGNQDCFKTISSKFVITEINTHTHKSTFKRWLVHTAEISTHKK